VSAHPPSESARSPAHKSESAVGDFQNLLLIPAADVFIGTFNDTGSSKQSQIN
jgi:hypothetical protein